MSFVNDSESLWEFIGAEKDWENLGLSLRHFEYYVAASENSGALQGTDPN